MMRKNKSAADAKVSTIIGQGTVFDGNLSSSDNIRIDGTVNGNCNCEAAFILGETGVVIGNISANNIIISGQVKGDITAKGSLEFLPTGKLTGNITANTLVIDEGAYFDGKCVMTSDSQAPSFAQRSGADE